MSMKRNIFRKSSWDIIKSALVPIIFSLAIMGMIIFGLQETDASGKDEAVRVLEDSIRQAVIMSYAVEGKYPDTVEYIEQHYGVKIDRNRYLVHYNVFASNLMPDIMVLEVGK